MFKTAELVEADISKLMDETYSTQRSAITSSNIQTVTVNWPFLKEPKYLILHSNRLLGKDVDNVYISFLTENARKLRQCLKREIKDDKKLLLLLTNIQLNVRSPKVKHRKLQRYFSCF